MKVYVISLESDHARKSKLLKNFPKSFADFHFINAVDGRKLSASDYFNYIKQYLYENNRILTPSEVGCALSHMLAYEKIIENNAPALILEDDILGDDNKLEAAKQLLDDIKPDEIILLGGLTQSKETNRVYIYPTAPVKNSDEIVYKIDPKTITYLGSACCYLIGVGAAKCILESQKRSLKLADNWYLLTSNQHNITFKFVQLFQHTLVTQLTNENSHLEEQRKSLIYKKTYMLFWGSCLESIRKIKLGIYSFIKGKILNNGYVSLSKVIVRN